MTKQVHDQAAVEDLKRQRTQAEKAVAIRDGMESKYASDRELAAYFSVSRATVWRWTADKTGTFPQPTTLSKGVTRWTWDAVHLWEVGRVSV